MQLEILKLSKLKEEMGIEAERGSPCSKGLVFPVWYGISTQSGQFESQYREPQWNIPVDATSHKGYRGWQRSWLLNSQEGLHSMGPSAAWKLQQV